MRTGLFLGQWPPLPSGAPPIFGSQSFVKLKWKWCVFKKKSECEIKKLLEWDILGQKFRNWCHSASLGSLCTRWAQLMRGWRSTTSAWSLWRRRPGWANQERGIISLMPDNVSSFLPWLLILPTPLYIDPRGYIASGPKLLPGAGRGPVIGGSF